MRDVREKESGKDFKRRLRGVRKRKRAERAIGCEVMAFKMRLVRARENECTGQRGR